MKIFIVMSLLFLNLVSLYAGENMGTTECNKISGTRNKKDIQDGDDLDDKTSTDVQK